MRWIELYLQTWCLLKLQREEQVNEYLRVSCRDNIDGTK